MKVNRVSMFELMSELEDEFDIKFNEINHLGNTTSRLLVNNIKRKITKARQGDYIRLNNNQVKRFNENKIKQVLAKNEKQILYRIGGCIYFHELLGGSWWFMRVV